MILVFLLFIFSCRGSQPHDNIKDPQQLYGSVTHICSLSVTHNNGKDIVFQTENHFLLSRIGVLLNN